MTTQRGLMVGRFQPFHRGHLALSAQILEECDELVIAIGSAQFNFIEKDPFTAGERVVMAHGALAEAGLDLARCYIIPVENHDNNAMWLANLRSMVPEFHFLYSGNDYVKHLARSQDPRIEIRQPRFEKKDEYNGSHIRGLALSGGKWKQLVPAAVAREIERIGGIERMRLISSMASDSRPQEW